MSGALGAVPACLVAAAVLVLVGPPPRSRLRSVLVDERPAGGRPWTSQHGTGAALVALVTGIVVARSGGPVLATLVLAGLAAGRRARSAHHRRTAGAREREALVEALAVLAAELRAGRPTTAALAAAAEVGRGPSGAALAAAARAGPLGADPAALLRESAPACAVPHVLTGLATCWQLCAGTGSSLAQAVSMLADDVRAELAQQHELDAELAGPRATAGLLAVLPVAGIGLAAALGADPLHVLLHTPVGVGCLVGAIAFDAAGLWWTRALVRGAGGQG